MAPSLSPSPFFCLALAPALLPALALVSLPASLGAQAPPIESGYDLTKLHTASGPFSISLAAPGLAGHAVAAMGNVLADLPGNGSALPIFALPATEFIGAIARERGRDTVWFTSYTTNALYALDLRTLTRLQGSCPKNTFDLDVGAGGLILASANPTWPGPGNATGIWAVDLLGGQHRELVRLPGASGPVAFAQNGDVLVGVTPAAFPPPPKSSKLLLFARAKIDAARGTGPRLSEADASAVLPGLDGIYDLAIDDRGRAYWSDGNLGGVGRTRPGQLVADPVPLIAPTGLGTVSLGFTEKGKPTFDAFQPADGGELLVLTSDWTTACHVFVATPRRASLVASPSPVAPPGPVALLVIDAAPAAALALGISLLPPRTEGVLVELAGIPMTWALDPVGPTVWLPATVAQDGSARFDLVHPGGFTASLAIQAAFVAGAGVEVRCGTTPARTLLLKL